MLTPAEFERLIGLGAFGVLILGATFVLLLVDKLLPHLWKRNGGPRRTGDLEPSELEVRIAHVVATTMEPVMNRQTEILRDLAAEQRRASEMLREILIYSRGRDGGQV